MDIEEFWSDLQAVYLAEFEEAVRQERLLYPKVVAEIAFQLSPETGLYRDLYVVDLGAITSDGRKLIELEPSAGALLGPAEFETDGMLIRFDEVSWDAMEFLLAPEPQDIQGLSDWFQHWLDVDRAPPMDGIANGIIHSLAIEGNRVSVDFGTAPPEAASELLERFRLSGVRLVVVRSGRVRR